MSMARQDSAKVAKFAENLGFTSTIKDETNAGESGVFTFAPLDTHALKSSPIRSEWILDGKPEARCAHLSSGNRGFTSTDHWSCTAGKFRWYYGWDETVLFVEGAVTITDDNGTVYRGQPGVSLFFPAGTWATWEVPTYIRKIAFNQRTLPWHLTFLARAEDKMLRILGLKKSPTGGL